MKKHLLIFAILIGTLPMSIAAQTLSVIEGIWDRGSLKDIKLFAIKNGEQEEISTTKIGSDHTFAFAFYPEKEAFYTIGLNPNMQKNSYTFYFKPGDKLSVKFTQTGVELTGKKNTPENKEIAAWMKFTEPLDIKIHRYTPEANLSTYVDFFPLLEEKVKAMSALPAIKTPNAHFNKQFTRYREVDMINKAISYTFTPRTALPEGEDYSDYYHSFDLKDLGKDEFLLTFPTGLYLYSMIPARQFMTNPDVTKEEILKFMSIQQQEGPLGNEALMNSIDPKLRAALLLKFARSKKTIESLDILGSKYGQFLFSDAQKKEWNDIRIPLIKNDAGAPATNFTFKDVDGKEVSLSDFKGKVVYIDVWATWCGPCKAQIPHLIKLEEKYKDNPNIVFLGVSVDKDADKEKWKNFLVEKELPGIQLFAGDAGTDKIMRPYKISGIPRFILVDKNGNLISSNAPRPSQEEEIGAVLDNALKK